MEKPEFEKDFREKLSNRELQPAADSWNRLRGQLDAQAGRRSARIYWWTGVAALIALGLVVSDFLSNESEGPSVVIEQSALEEVEHSQGKPELEATQEEAPKSATSISASFLAAESSEREEPIEKQVQGVIAQVPEPPELEPAQTQPPLSEPIVENSPTVTDHRLLQKVDQVIVEAQQLEQENGKVSDAEVEALLLVALQDLNDRSDSRPEEVDADALLAEVETELEASFRKRVFQLVKQGLEMTRTAVVDRIQN